MKKVNIVLFLLVVVCALSFTLIACVQETNNQITVVATPEPTSSPTPSPTPEPTPVVETVRFSATGDNLIHDAIYENAARKAAAEDNGEEYDFDFCFTHVKDFYADFDLNWINQETLLNNEFAPAGYPQFSTPGEMGQSLYDIGMRVFQLSNNHTYDLFGSGVQATIDYYETLPDDVVTTGIWADGDDMNIPTSEVNGITFAYLAYTFSTNGIPHPNGTPQKVIYTTETERIQAQVAKADEIADFVLVGVHWGTEDSHTIHYTQEDLAQNLTEWGADLIIGTHPHVLQGAEWLTAADESESFVCYSLGNFISSQSKAPNLIGGILDITFEKTTNPDGTISLSMHSPYIHPIVTHYGGTQGHSVAYLFKDYTPELASGHSVLRHDGRFSYDFISQTITNNIPEEFLPTY